MQPTDKSDNTTNQSDKGGPRAGIYKHLMYLTGELKDAMDLFLESKKWSRTERHIMDLLRRRLKKYGFLNNSEKEEKNETN
jgi:hypothetical protein